MKTNPHLVVLLFLSVMTCGVSLAQTKPKTETTRQTPTCKSEDALTLLDQQIDATKTFADDRRRVEVLIRAADILWLYQEENARKAYTEAFSLAKRDFAEKGERVESEGKLGIRGPDLRYSVIKSIARHDVNWSKKLVAELLKEQEEEASNKPTSDAKQAERTAEQLLSVASSLLETDEAASLSAARSSLKYPATMHLAEFLYTFSSHNRPAADQFYQEALATYANAAMERLLYLSAYPFGNSRDAGDMPSYMIYQVPPDFAPNPGLQRLLVQTILRRVERFINNPADVTPGTRVSDPEEMWLALTRLEVKIRQSLPDLAPQVAAARNDIAARLSPESQRDLRGRIGRDNPTSRTFDEQVESALKNPNVDARDQGLTFAVINSSKAEAVDKVLEVIDKISDSEIRKPLLSWFFFARSQQVLKEQQFDEARKFAARVGELDQRVFLYSEIAGAALKRNPDQTVAREMLEEIVDAAAKAPNTVVKARALFAVAALYTKIDLDRAVAVVGEAIECVNRIEQPDFSRQFVIRKIEGKSFGMYATIVTAGYKPETALAEIAGTDFDNMVSQASRLSDKSLRAITIIAIAERCLKSLPAVKSRPAGKP